MSARPGGAMPAAVAALLAATALAWPAALGLPAGTANAARQPEPAGAPSVSLNLNRIDGVVTPGGSLRVRLQISNSSRQDREGLRLVATVHGRTTSRFEYQQATDAGVVGTIVHGFSAPVGVVPARGARTLDLVQQAADLGLDDIEGLEGVYPLRLQLLEADDVVDELVTSLVATAERVANPLNVSLLYTIARGPSRDAAGTFRDSGLVEDLHPRGAIGDVLAALSAHQSLPLTVAVDGYTLQEMADLAGGAPVATGAGPVTLASDSPQAERAAGALDRLRGAAGRPHVELLALPYASADLVALVRGGLAGEASRHLADGVRAVEAATGVRPDDEVLMPPDGITEEALGHALVAGARAAILPSAYLAVPEIAGLTPSAVRRLRAGPGTSLPVLVPDPWLEATMRAPARTPAAAAQRLLGELATIYFERPGVAERGVLLSLPPEGVATQLASELAGAVASLPVLEPVTVSELRRGTAEEPGRVGLEYPPAARLRELPAGYVTALRESRRALGSLDGVLVGDRATTARFDRLLLQAASVRYRPGDAPALGRALMSAVTSTVDGLYRAVVVPETPAVTLTSVEGELPVTVRSEADVPLRVHVHLRTARLEVEGGPTREIVLEPHETHIMMLPVRALTPGGTAPVDVAVTDTDGEVVLAQGQVVVRSTAFSVTAVLVVAGAALFLLAWIAREAARRRQGGAGRPVAAAASDGRRARREVGSGSGGSTGTHPDRPRRSTADRA